MTEEERADKIENLRRYEDARRAHLGATANLTFVLAAAAVGFCASSATNEDARFSAPGSYYCFAAVVAFIVTVGLCMLTSWTRLSDFRLTARKLRRELRGADEWELNELGTITDRLGKRTWFLLRVQLITFGVGVGLLAIALWLLYHDHLFPKQGGETMNVPAFFSSEVFWTAVGSIATVVGVVAIVLGIFQLRFEAWLKAQEIWTTREFTDARGRIFARLDSHNRDWTTEEEIEAHNVCRKMDEFAGLIPYLPKRTALRIWGVPFAKAWVVLEPLVAGERKKTGWPEKWHAFERLGRSALRRHPETRKDTHS